MTVEQVKQELKELKSIMRLRFKRVEVYDKKGLEKKYDKAMESLNDEEKAILFNRIYLGEPYFKIGMLLNYSEETIRKKYSKIIDKIANMVEIKKTNFDRITESEEALAQFLAQYIEHYKAPREVKEIQVDSIYNRTGQGLTCAEAFKEWLQKEAE